MEITGRRGHQVVKDVSKLAVERKALERSFVRFRFSAGRRTWKRADLHVRTASTIAK